MWLPLFAFAIVADLASQGPPAMTHRYRIELSVRSEVDLSGLGAPAQIQEQRAVSFVTVQLRDSAGGRSLLARVDSATFDPGGVPIPQDVDEQAAGATLSGFVDPAGEVHSLVASSDNPVVGMLESVFGDFYPRRAMGRGSTWSDTLQLATRISGGDTRTVVITVFTAGGTESFGGTMASRTQSAFTTTMEGTLLTGAGEAAMTGTGSGTGSYYTAGDGTFLGGSRTTTQKSSITLALSPAPIPIQTTTLLVVTLIP